MEKVIRNGMVAVLYSPGFGAGWYTWNSKHKELLFHPKLIEAVEKGNRKAIDEEWIQDNLGIRHVYTGGADNLEIAWLPEGSEFMVDEYDGSESIITIDSLSITA